MSSNHPNQQDLFRQVIAALERAREDEVPAYARTTFAEAVAAYEEARALARECAASDEVAARLETALAAIGRATENATAVRPYLAPVVEKRAQLMVDQWTRESAPALLYEADLAYEEMIRLAEEGRSDAAEEQGARVLALFREATLTGLQAGPMRNLENQLAYAHALVPGKRVRKAKKQLEKLARDLERARAGDLSVDAMRTRLAAGGNVISALMRPIDDFGMDADYHDAGVIGWAPGTFGPPEAPLTMRIKNRTASNMTVTWLNRAGLADANVLERQETDGTWLPVASYGPLSGWTTHIDAGLLPDTRYCYRVRTSNSFGARFTPQPNRPCGYTRDGNDLSIWRLQLRIRVADVSNAGTGDPVRVRLNSPLKVMSPFGNGTWLDYGPEYSVVGGSLVISDDFARGREFTYDLNIKYLSELGDITMLSLKKEGTNALGIAEIALLVNGVQVFHRLFGETAGTCLWIDEGDGHSPVYTVFHEELRAHPSWAAYIASPPFPSLTIPNAEIVSRIEGIIGDRIHGTQLKWGHFFAPDWVQATRVNESTLHVDVDLEADVSGPNPEVDLDFDLIFAITCDDDVAILTIDTANYDPDVNYSWFDDLITLGIVEAFDDDIKKRIKEDLEPISLSFDIPAGGLCPSIRVDPNGDIRFVL